MFLPSFVTPSKALIQTLLTQAEKDSGKSKRPDLIQVPVRVTFDKNNMRGAPESIVRGEFEVPDPVTPLGLDTVETDTHITLNAILMHMEGGFSRISLTPAQARRMDLTGTVFESFRLRADYLPCPCDTKAGEKWTNGNGTATIDIKTQKVLDIQFVDNLIGQPDDQYEGHVVAADDDTITVTCVMANGGVNFSGFVR
jgi:hypothetical protein